MSRTGKKPIPIPKGVDVKIDGLRVEVKGPKGTLAREFIPGVQIVKEEDTVVVTRDSDSKPHRSLHGLTRSLIANMVEGVDKGYMRELEIHGVGYRVKLAGNALDLVVGHSHPVKIEPPEGIEFEVDEKKNTFKVKGISKELVGRIAAEIRRKRVVDPYKGKGIRFAGEKVVLKVGKRAK